MILYFSGTGNSRYAAQALAAAAGEEPVDVLPWLQKKDAGRFFSEGPWVFACPTYAWRIPRIFEDFIRRSSFEGAREAYFVMTCGSEIGDAARFLRSLCEEKGFVFRGVLQLEMPENYVAMFPVPGEEECRELLVRARKKLAAAAEALKEGRDFPLWKPGALDKIKSGFINEGFNRFFLKADKFQVGDACIGCGKCRELCPTDNIRLVSGRPVWGQTCCHCMACLSHCPAQAIEYGKKSRGKRRWLCPEWEK